MILKLYSISKNQHISNWKIVDMNFYRSNKCGIWFLWLISNLMLGRPQSGMPLILIFWCKLSKTFKLSSVPPHSHKTKILRIGDLSKLFAIELRIWTLFFLWLLYSIPSSCRIDIGENWWELLVNQLTINHQTSASKIWFNSSCTNMQRM